MSSSSVLAVHKLALLAGVTNCGGKQTAGERGTAMIEVPVWKESRITDETIRWKGKDDGALP